jgi:hypothetical protein
VCARGLRGWWEADEPRGYVPPTREQLAQRVAAETWAARVKYYKRFGVVPPPLCASHGVHERGADCDACIAKRAADARIRETLAEREPLVRQGFTWVRGRMEFWPDIEDEVRHGGAEVRHGMDEDRGPWLGGAGQGRH